MRHKSQLKHNKHYNSHLQRSYNKHGEEVFEYVVVEECDVDDLSIREQHWIDTYRNKLYNTELYVKDQEGCHNRFYGKNHTKETKAKMSLSKKDVYNGKDNPNFGNKWSDKQRDKMRGSKNAKSKLNENDVVQIKEMLATGMKHANIADKFGVGRTVVTRINSGSRWGHIKIGGE